MMESTAEECIVCGQTRTDGIRIVSRFICADCESDIVRTDVEDDMYGYFVERLRALWLDLASTAPDVPGSSCS